MNKQKDRQPDHKWVNRNNPKSFTWEERDCAVCGLHDMRLQNKNEIGGRKEWTVITPCIVVPPETISFEDLIADLKQHGVECENIYNCGSIPFAMGDPRKWTIGFKSQGRHDSINMAPAFVIKPPLTLEHGWSQILRWMRARNYKPYMYPGYEDTNGSGDRTIKPASCHCHDDD